MTAKSRHPSREPTMVPLPPIMEVPPMITEDMMVISVPVATAVWALLKRLAMQTPQKAASTDTKTLTMVLVFPTSIPASLAVS